MGRAAYDRGAVVVVPRVVHGWPFVSSHSSLSCSIRHLGRNRGRGTATGGRYLNFA